MPFVRNLWYVAAWADEVADNLLGRQLLGAHVLIYRQEDGQAVAIGGACPHRFAPLHQGRRVGDAVECPYHGLRFGPSGACVANPHGDGAIPQAARVPAYPVEERDALLWIWMGAPDAADPAAIPDFHRLVNPALRSLRGRMTTQANYQIVADNLLDLSHSMFLHATFHRTEGRLRTPQDVVQDGNTIHSRRWIPNSAGPPSLMRNFVDPATPVDYWVRIRWDAPGLCQLDTGVTPTGRPEREGFAQENVHILTPETEFSTHYFYANNRAYAQDDTDEDARIREWQRIGFAEQDKPMIEAVQRMLGPVDLMARHPVLLAVDAAAMRARRVIDTLLAQERRQTTAA